MLNYCAIRFSFVFANRPEPVLMSDDIRKEAPCLERRLDLKLIPDFKWNAYIHVIAKRCRKNYQTFVSLQNIPNICYHAQDSDMT